MSRIFHIFANRMNIGDWLSARAIQSQLPGRPIISLLCDHPHVEYTLDKLSQASPDDFIVIGGGGLLMDYFMPFWRGFDAVSRRIPFAVWGIGVCDLKQRASCADRAVLSAILSKACMCVLRDELSREFFADLKLATPVPCPSLLATDRPIALGPALLHAIHYEVIGELRHPPLVDLIRSCAHAVGREYLETNNEVDEPDETALCEKLGLYAQSELVISSRLHGCILGLAHGCKVLALAGDRKIESFMHAAGLGEWICDPDDFNAIRRLLKHLPAQRDSSEFVQEARRKNIEIGRELNQLIAGKAAVRSL